MKRILAIMMLLLILTLFASNFAALMASEGTKTGKTQTKSNIHLASLPKSKSSKDKNAICKKEEVERIAISYKQDTLKIHRATWYRTDMHSKVHREHPTAAYNFAPKGTMLLITNTENGKSCVVEVTDRMGTKAPNKIDLSHKAFGMLDSHSRGFIIVTIRTYEEEKYEQKSTNNQI